MYVDLLPLFLVMELFMPYLPYACEVLKIHAYLTEKVASYRAVFPCLGCLKLLWTTPMQIF